MPDDFLGMADAAEADDALGHDQPDVLLKPLVPLPAPVGEAFLHDGRGVQPNRSVLDFGVERGHVVGEWVEGAAPGQVELGMVPVARQDSVSHRAPVEGESHVRTAIVQGVHFALVQQDQDGVALHRHDLEALGLQLLQGADFDCGVFCRFNRCHVEPPCCCLLPPPRPLPAFAIVSPRRGSIARQVGLSYR